MKLNFEIAGVKPQNSIRGWPKCVFQLATYVLALLLVGVLPSQAAPLRILEEKVELQFRPERAIFVVLDPAGDRNTGFMASWNGSIVEADSAHGEQSQYDSEWIIVGAGPVPDEVRRLRYNLIVSGRANQYQIEPGKTVELSQDNLFLSDIDPLIKRIAHLNGEILTQGEKARQLDARLSELRANAEVIGNFEEIRELRRQREAAEREIAAVGNYNQSLRGLIDSIKFAATPTSFARRESELTKQLAELAQASQDAERELRARQK